MTAPRRSAWLKTLNPWHWISSALCLIGMLLFALTRITLNLASRIEMNPRVVDKQAQLPAALLAALKVTAGEKDHHAPPARTGARVDRQGV